MAECYKTIEYPDRKAIAALYAAGAKAGMMPVPRKLSSSCGTCVRYEAEDAMLEKMDVDVEGVYEVTGKDQYTRLMEKE